MFFANVIRAPKDAEDRLRLTEAERARLPESPAGLADLTEAEQSDASGGFNPIVFWLVPIYMN
jgi:mersacidin/lichenicidin family type 2 lantibiotic